MLVACRDCRYAILDANGSGSGLCHCRIYDHCDKKGLSDQERRKLLMQLGNTPYSDAFWPGLKNGPKTRTCEKYAAIEINNVVDIGSKKQE
ncbi:MAG: hypothetical protein ACXW0T_08845 [Methylobacter sp.]